jgi:hypothetical protein
LITAFQLEAEPLAFAQIADPERSTAEMCTNIFDPSSG